MTMTTDKRITKHVTAISIVVPVYNESAGIAKFHNDVLAPELLLIEKRDFSMGGGANSLKFEIVYVNDGSRDDSLEILHQLTENGADANDDNAISTVIVNLSKNFGKEIAVTAGISAATGDAIIIMDADGQHPPRHVKEFIDRWLAGAQVVVGVRTNHGGGAIKTAGSKLFYRLLNTISDSHTVPNSTDFRLISRSVTDEFLRFAERKRITRGLIDWLGYKRAYVHFEAPERLAGEATYSMRKLAGLALNSFITLSLRPLFLFGYLGMLISILSFLVGCAIIVQQYIMGDPLKWQFTGTASLGIFVSFLVGLILMAQGMLAVYMAHIYTQTQGRPLFVIDTDNSRNLPEK